MATAETARLVTSLELQDKFSPGIQRAERKLSGFERSFGSLGGKLKTGFALGAGAAAFNLVARAATGLFGVIETGVTSLNELQAVQAGTTAVIKSTGAVAHLTAAQVHELAGSLEDYSTVDDKVIQGGENLLLTFTNVKNAVGAGNDIFNQATKASLDMAVAMNQGDKNGIDLKATSIQLGKALNDPFKGYTALKKVGVSFSADQIKQLKIFEKTHNVLGAQKLILKELRTEFGGAAKDTGTYADAQRKLGDAVENLQTNLVQGLLPGLTRASAALAAVFKSPEFIQGAKDLGTAIGSALSPENIRGFIGMARSVAGTLKDLFGALKAGWESVPPELRDLLIKGAVVDRTFKFLFGFSPAKLVVGVATDAIAKGLGALVGSIFSRATPMPVIVTNPSALGGGGVGGVGGKAGTVMNILGAVTIVGLAAEIASLVAGPVQDAAQGVHEQFFKGTIFDDLGKQWTHFRETADWPIGQRNAPAWASLGGGSEPGKAMTGPFQTDIRGYTGFEGKGPGFRPAAGDTWTKVAKGLDQLHKDFLANNQILRESKDPAAIAKAATAAAAEVTKGVGSVGTTKDIIATLKRQLAATKDPALRRVLETALRKVERKLPGREWIAAQKEAATKIATSNKSVADKVKELKGIQERLIAHGDTAAANIVGALLNSVVPAINATKSVYIPGYIPPYLKPDSDLPIPSYIKHEKPYIPPSNPDLPIPNPSKGEKPYKTKLSVSLTASPKDITGARITHDRIGHSPAQNGG